MNHFDVDHTVLPFKAHYRNRATAEELATAFSRLSYRMPEYFTVLPDKSREGYWYVTNEFDPRLATNQLPSV